MAESEFSLIEQCFVSKAKSIHRHTIVGNGDDASVHELAEGEQLVVSTDTAVQSVHWPDDFPLDQAADRAVCAALSDLAAMGAEAAWVWVSAMAIDKPALRAMGQGVSAACKRYDVELAGGDTVHAPLNSLNITVAGILPKNTAMQRNSAKKGDKVWLCGQSGLAALGLEQWQKGDKGGEFVSSFSMIVPQLKSGNTIREMGVDCCIDVSDGVLQDAGHICAASRIGMRLELSDFPTWARLHTALGEEKAAQMILSGGEDYALLFTAASDIQGLENMACCVGSCVAGQGIEVLYENETMDVTFSGYDHFATS